MKVSIGDDTKKVRASFLAYLRRKLLTVTLITMKLRISQCLKFSLPLLNLFFLAAFPKQLTTFENLISCAVATLFGSLHKCPSWSESKSFFIKLREILEIVL